MLKAYAAAIGTPAEGSTYLAAVAELQDARVLVPVVAVADTVDTNAAGLTVDKDSSMAAVLLAAPDGRRGLLAFSGAAELAAWNPQARPVPVLLPQAAQAALHEEASALILDVASPHKLVLEGELLDRLGRGQRLIQSNGEWAWIVTNQE